MEIVEEVATYLQTSGVGVIKETIFMNTLPDSPEQSIAVLNTGGLASIEPIPKRHGISILARAPNHNVGLTMAWQIYNLLHNKWNILPESTGRVVGGLLPGLYYHDENDRLIYSLSFTVEAAWKK